MTRTRLLWHVIRVRVRVRVRVRDRDRDRDSVRVARRVTGRAEFKQGQGCSRGRHVSKPKLMSS